MKYTKLYICLLLLVAVPTIVVGYRNAKSAYSNRPATNEINALFADKYCKDNENHLTEVFVAKNVNLINEARKLTKKELGGSGSKYGWMLTQGGIENRHMEGQVWYQE